MNVFGSTVADDIRNESLHSHCDRQCTDSMTFSPGRTYLTCRKFGDTTTTSLITTSVKTYRSAPANCQVGVAFAQAFKTSDSCRLCYKAVAALFKLLTVAPVSQFDFPYATFAAKLYYFSSLLHSKGATISKLREGLQQKCCLITVYADINESRLQTSHKLYLRMLLRYVKMRRSEDRNMQNQPSVPYIIYRLHVLDLMVESDVPYTGSLTQVFRRLPRALATNLNKLWAAKRVANA